MLSGETWPLVEEPELLEDRRLLLSGRQGSRDGQDGNTVDSALVDRITHFIETHLAEPLTLNRLAAHVSLSPTHFAKTFRAATGTPPHRFVVSRRMERARTLVTGSDSSVVEIAYAVGYSNVSYFRRSFRRKFGVLPRELRSDATSAPPCPVGEPARAGSRVVTLAAVAPLSADSNCHAGYKPCIPRVRALNCPDIGHRVTVVGSDVYRLDADHDRTRCDRYPEPAAGR